MIEYVSVRSFYKRQNIICIKSWKNMYKIHPCMLSNKSPTQQRQILFFQHDLLFYVNMTFKALL